MLNEINKDFDTISSNFLKLKNLTPEIVKACEVCIDSLKTGGKIMFCGNGGSAADSSCVGSAWKRPMSAGLDSAFRTAGSFVSAARIRRECAAGPAGRSGGAGGDEGSFAVRRNAGLDPECPEQCAGGSGGVPVHVRGLLEGCEGRRRRRLKRRACAR